MFFYKTLQCCPQVYNEFKNYDKKNQLQKF